MSPAQLRERADEWIRKACEYSDKARDLTRLGCDSAAGMYAEKAALCRRYAVEDQVTAEQDERRSRRGRKAA